MGTKFPVLKGIKSYMFSCKTQWKHHMNETITYQKNIPFSVVQQVLKSLGLMASWPNIFHDLFSQRFSSFPVLSRQKNPFFTYRKDVFSHSGNKAKQNGFKQRGPGSCHLPSPHSISLSPTPYTQNISTPPATPLT